jgi:hypothetical protein
MALEQPVAARGVFRCVSVMKILDCRKPEKHRLAALSGKTQAESSWFGSYASRIEEWTAYLGMKRPTLYDRIQKFGIARNNGPN